MIDSFLLRAWDVWAPITVINGGVKALDFLTIVELELTADVNEKITGWLVPLDGKEELIGHRFG